jgi:hypothetical protein
VALYNLALVLMFMLAHLDACVSWIVMLVYPGLCIQSATYFVVWSHVMCSNLQKSSNDTGCGGLDCCCFDSWIVAILLVLHTYVRVCFSMIEGQAVIRNTDLVSEFAPSDRHVHHICNM